MADVVSQLPELSDPEPPKPAGHPVGFFFIFSGEFAERCSYYGMRAILPIYLTTVLAIPDERATQYYSYFKASCYLLPLLGGYLADRFFGKYWTIVGFSIPYILGQFLLGLNSIPAMAAALVLLACGSGVIKPNISTLMGLTYDEQRPGNVQLRSAAFQWFYFSINIGAMISMAVLPFLRDSLAARHHGSALAEGAKYLKEDYAYAYPITFLFPALLMIGALGAFAAGKRFYAKEIINAGKSLSPEERAEQKRVLTTLLGLFLLMTFFWVAYEQNDSLWVFFARDYMDLTLNFGFKSVTFAPDGLQFVNAAMVLTLIPFFNWLWPVVDPTGKKFPATLKMLMGFVLTACATGVMVLASYSAGATVVKPEPPRPAAGAVESRSGDVSKKPTPEPQKGLNGEAKPPVEEKRPPVVEKASTPSIAPGAASPTTAGNKVSGWWLVLAYVVLTVGEVLLYGTGLELAFTAAPDSMKSFVTACYLLTNFLGNMANSVWGPHYNSTLSPFAFFGITAAVTLAAAVVFHFVGKQFDRNTAKKA